MRPMSEAPRDGTRILLKYWPRHYTRLVGKNRFERLGWHRIPQPKWEEFRYRVSEFDGDRHRWEEWTGDERCSSTNHVSEADCIGWLPLPE